MDFQEEAKKEKNCRVLLYNCFENSHSLVATHVCSLPLEENSRCHPGVLFLELANYFLFLFCAQHHLANIRETRHHNKKLYILRLC
jgi:hypothetical protein